MPAPEERNPGNHSVRCRTTSRAVQPATGEGTSQDRVPRTRSVNRAGNLPVPLGWDGQTAPSMTIRSSLA